jgi:hypothetical protein
VACIAVEAYIVAGTQQQRFTFDKAPHQAAAPNHSDEVFASCEDTVLFYCEGSSAVIPLQNPP